MRALWHGQLSLARAFWEYAVAYVLIVNLFATGTSLAIIAADMPSPLAIAVFLSPAPYVLVAVVGVWRSAAAYTGPAHWAVLARYAAIAWGGLMLLI